MTAYYNEFDKFAAQWLRNLIDAGHIAPGEVDERSIEDVHPNDLRGFTQCHFFAGIGVWSYALRNAGWPDDRQVWTGSCPCQPFSAAGKGTGFADERHLWPAFHWLIQECRPVCVLGEQVASKDADPWIDLVQADLEAMDYAFGCVPFPSAGVGAPHIRDRLYWMADSQCGAAERYGLPVGGETEGSGRHVRARAQRIRDDAGDGGDVGGMVYAVGAGLERHAWNGDGGSQSRRIVADQAGPITEAGFTSGFWRNADWIYCRDNKWRPVESGAFPLAHGSPSRMGRLRAYGNAINAEAATEFIRATGLIA